MLLAFNNELLGFVSPGGYPESDSTVGDWQYLFATRGLIQPVNLNQRHTGGVIHSAHNHRVVAWR